MHNWQKIVFLNELILNLEVNRWDRSKQFKEWYNHAVYILEQYKQYYINQESDEQDRQEREWGH